MEKKIRDLYCGFTDDKANILGKIIIGTQPNGWISEETLFFITGGHKRIILGNDSLPNLGIGVKQKKCPRPICSVSQPPSESKWNKPFLPTDKIFNNFNELFTQVEKFLNDRKVTHFHSPFKRAQAKGRRVPLHLLAGVNEQLRKMETGCHIIKLEKCDEDCFISTIDITRKNEGSIKLALNFKLLNDQIFKNKYQMPNIYGLIQFSENSARQVCFSNLDLKNA